MFSGPANAGGLALTFDDGPNATHTPKLLDQLGRYNIRATFFLVGGCMEDHPDLVRRIVAEGHAVGHHSWWHRSEGTSSRTLGEEVQQCRKLIHELTGIQSNLFRPPRGNLSVAKILNLWRLRQHVVMWNVDPRDYLMRSSAEARGWAEKYKPAAGDVVLLHDDHPFVLDFIPQLANSARERNLTFETIPTWLNLVQDPQPLTDNPKAPPGEQFHDGCPGFMHHPIAPASTTQVF